MALVPGRPG